MYTEKEVKELLKMQKKVCSDIASANWGSHVGKSVLKSPDVPLVKSALTPVSNGLPDECQDYARGNTGCVMNGHCIKCK